MFGIGVPELVIVLLIVLVVFGAGKLPEVAGAMGKSIRNFKKAAEGKEEIEIRATPAEINSNKEAVFENASKSTPGDV